MYWNKTIVFLIVVNVLALFTVFCDDVKLHPSEMPRTIVENVTEELMVDVIEPVINYVEYDVPRNFNSFAYEFESAITSTNSPQYALISSEETWTDENGYKRNGAFYLVALGSYFNNEIGTKYRITFDDGRTIQVMVGDQKADKDTDATHTYSSDGSMVEYIVSKGFVHSNILLMGGKIVKIEMEV